MAVYCHFTYSNRRPAQEPAKEILKFAKASAQDDREEGCTKNRCPVLTALSKKSVKKGDPYRIYGFQAKPFLLSMISFPTHGMIENMFSANTFLE